MSSSSFNVLVVAPAVTEVMWGRLTESIQPVLRIHQTGKLG